MNVDRGDGGVAHIAVRIKDMKPLSLLRGQSDMSFCPGFQGKSKRGWRARDGAVQRVSITSHSDSDQGTMHNVSFYHSQLAFFSRSLAEIFGLQLKQKSQANRLMDR